MALVQTSCCCSKVEWWQWQCLVIARCLFFFFLVFGFGFGFFFLVGLFGPWMFLLSGLLAYVSIVSVDVLHSRSFFFSCHEIIARNHEHHEL